MPAKSQNQQQFMAMCLHSPGKVKGDCPPQKVAKEYAQKPKGGYDKKGKK
jgi:hypothetical protein